jgi:archaellum component FlaC
MLFLLSKSMSVRSKRKSKQHNQLRQELEVQRRLLGDRLSRMEANAQSLIAYLNERKGGVEGSEDALKELEKLVDNINAVKKEYEQLQRERRVREALSRTKELAVQLDRYERTLASIAQKLRLQAAESPEALGRAERDAWKVGLDKLVKALEAARSRGSGCEVNDLLEVLKTVGELEKVYGFAAAGRAGGGGLKAEGLLVIREYAKEALYRLITGGDPSSLIGEALSVAKALEELEALAEKGVRIVNLEDLEVVGYVDGVPIYTLRRRDSPDR